MSIATAIQNAQNKIANCYTAIANKGGTIPATQDLANMPNAINSISGGGGGSSGHVFEIKLKGASNFWGFVTDDSMTTHFDYSVNFGGSESYETKITQKIKTIRFTGDWYGGYNYGTIYIGGVSRSITPDITYNLASDSDYCEITVDQCLTKDTSITLANSGTKPIWRLKVGDKVLSINPQTGEKEEDEIIYCDGQENKTAQEYDVWEFEDCYFVKTTNHHRFYNVERQAFVYLDEFNIGEHTIVREGKQVALKTHKTIKEEVQHCTIATKKWNNYFANGMLCGNRNSTEIHLGTEEQKKITSNPSESIGTFLNP